MNLIEIQEERCSQAFASSQRVVFQQVVNYSATILEKKKKAKILLAPNSRVTISFSFLWL